MNNRMFLGCWVIAAAALVAPLPSAAEGANAEGLLGYLAFDGSLEDQSGRVRDILTARGDKGAETAARFLRSEQLPGAKGQAIALGVEPGDAEYLTAPISKDLKLGPTYTIEMWIHPTDVGGWNRLVLNWGGGRKYAYHAAIHNGVFSLYHGQDGGRYVFAEGGEISSHRWHHVAAVARRNEADPAKSRLIVYVNGRRTGEAGFDGTIGRLDAEDFAVGDSAGIPDRSSRYRGYLDDLSLWNRALSEEELRKHYSERAETLDRLASARRRQRFARLEKFGFDEIVFAERGHGRDISGHYYANFGYSCVNPDVWFHAADGGRLTKLDVRSGKVTVLVDDPGGSVRDPQVHYDARKILFSYRKGGGHRYHLYEINADGTGLRQITDGPWDDIEPTYLPGGDIIFCSSRCRRWIGCWLAETAILFRCDPEGRDIRMLSSGSFTENTPAVLGDGRLLYTRWEYVNRDPVSFHHLWTMNPDGTGQMVYFGNMRRGGVFIDAKAIPGENRIVLINSSGHGRNEHHGYVATVSGKYGPNARTTMKNISKSNDFRDPYPLSGDAFLVARGNRILLMDSQGQTELLHTAGPLPVHEPRPLRRRPRENVIPPRLDFARSTATLLVGDVYSGRNMTGLKRGAVKKLLVMEDLPKPANFHGGGSQPLGHGVSSTLKRILGTVPVRPDGSAYFQVPAMRSIYFALLDEKDRSIKQMRSFVTLQPGETVGCVGCHEPRENTSDCRARAGLLALAGEPSRIEPIGDVPQIMDFPRDIQPILDRHCLRCHNHERREGGVTLSGDHGPVFSHSYYALYLHWQIKDTGGQPGHGTGRQPGNDKPYTTYSSASPLMDKLEPSHYDVQLSPHEKKMVRLWIDTGATYPGTYAAYGTGQVGGCWRNNEPIRVMADDWPCTPTAREAIQRRCGACHPKEQLPQHVTALVATDHGDMLSWTRPLSRYSRHNVYNLTRPQMSLVLLAGLSHEAGGYARGKPVGEMEKLGPVKEDRSQPPLPIRHPVIFEDAGDPDYRKILAHIRAAKDKLDEIKRFDTPGFKPNEHYVREMKRYGVLPKSFDRAGDKIDVYATDRAYFQTFWYKASPDSE